MVLNCKKNSKIKTLNLAYFILKLFFYACTIYLGCCVVKQFCI